MARRFDLEDVIAQNPSIDRDCLEEALRASEQIRADNLGRKPYDLAPPYGGRHVGVEEDHRPDPRLIRLSRDV